MTKDGHRLLHPDGIEKPVNILPDEDPDDWRAQDLLHLGARWWSLLAKLRCKVLSSGHIPCRWVEAKMVLIPKDSGGWRPLALTSVVWRAGTRALLARLKPWLESWAGPHLFGGLAGRGVGDCLLDPHQSRRGAVG